MITLTSQAAEQVRRSAEHSKIGNLYLRVAVRREEDGSFTYGMGFDKKNENDIHFISEGIDVLISPTDKELLEGATLDFVEISPGQNQFIFINPNDPAHADAQPPAESS